MPLNLSKSQLEFELKTKVQLYYPFSKSQFDKYSEILNWSKISCNENIKWTYELIQAFEHYLDWNYLVSNKGVTRKITLGLLFPQKVSVTKCHCSFQYDFCECDDQHFHNGNWETLIHIQDDMKSLSDEIVESICIELDDSYLEELIGSTPRH